MSNRQKVDLFYMGLRSFRAACCAMIEQIDMILALLDTPSEPEKKGNKKSAPASCDHPPVYRTPQPTMGKPSQFYCEMCKQLVEG